MLQEIHLKNFGNHADSLIQFSPGLTAFVGENGSGKSMISEAVSWLFYGRPIRARQGWSPVVPGESVVTGRTVSGMAFARKSMKSGTKLLCDNFKGGTRETNALIAEKFGSHSTFLQMQVFQRALLVRFSTAGDAERKAIIEDLLNISYFDEQYRLIRGDLKEINADLAIAESHERLWWVRLETAKDELERLRKPAKLDLGEDVSKARAELKRLKKKTISLPKKPGDEPSADDVYAAQDKLARLTAALGGVDASLREKKQLVADKLCPTCGAPTQRRLSGKIPELEREQQGLRTKYKNAQSALKEAKSEYDKEKRAYGEVVRKYRDALQEVDERDDRIARLERAIQRAEAAEDHYAKAFSQYRADQRRIRERIVRCRKEWAKARFEVLCLKDKVGRLEDLCRVFGPKGARVYMLRDALRAISASATDLMSKLYSKDVRVVLAPSDSMKTLVLSLVLPDGTTMPHRGGSEGEKTLLDFTLLKVLAALPRRSSTERLPFMYDDITDAFDTGNKERVLQALAEEAKTTQVLLFTHEAELVKEQLPDCRIYTVEAGTVHLGG